MKHCDSLPLLRTWQVTDGPDNIKVCLALETRTRQEIQIGGQETTGHEIQIGYSFTGFIETLHGYGLHGT